MSFKSTVKWLTILLLVLFPVGSTGTPNTRSTSTGQSGSTRNPIDVTFSFTVDPPTCTAPCTPEFRVRVDGTDIGVGQFALVCMNDASDFIPWSEARVFNKISDTSREYVFDKACTYESVGEYTPVALILFRGFSWEVASLGVTSTSSIDVDLTASPNNSVEPVDLTLTANVTGESGDATCEFWCSCEDGVGVPKVPPCVNLSDHTPAPGSPPIVSTFCVDQEEGVQIAAVSCLRNGVGPVTDYQYVVVKPQTISVSLVADPNNFVGPQLDNVDLIATVVDTCSEDTLELDFECKDGGGWIYQANATPLRTFSIVDDGVPSTDCDGYTDAAPPGDPDATDYKACVTATCTGHLSPAVESCTTITVQNTAPPPTFIANPIIYPSSMDEGYTGVDVILKFEGTATDGVSNIDVDCGTGGGWEGLAASIADPSSCGEVDEEICAGVCCSLIAETAFTGCDYPTYVGSPFTVSTTADRSLVTALGSAQVTVNEVLDPAIFSVSPSPWPSTISLQVTKGSDLPTQTITISNVGGDDLIWNDNDSETTSQTWVTCDTVDGITGSPDGSTINAGNSVNLYCAFDTSGLELGTYYSSVVVSDDGSPSGVTPTWVAWSYRIDVIPTSNDVVANINASRGVTGAYGEQPSPVGGGDACTAPCAVFFDSVGTTISGLNEGETFILGDYYWAFDDPKGEYWTQGAASNTSTRQDKNVEYGPTAGHLYEDPGSYQVKLTVCTSDGTKCDDAFKTIVVADPDSVYAGAETYCIANEGGVPVAGVGGCPAGATTVNTGDFDVALQTNCNVDETTSHVRCLFKKGDTFEFSARTSFRSNLGVQIGSYGSGAKPVISNAAGYSGNLFNQYSGWQDFTIYDLEFSSEYESGTTLMYARNDQLSFVQFGFLGITVSGFENTFNFDVGDADDGSRDYGGVYVYEYSDTDHYEGDYNNGYDFYIGATRRFWYAGGLQGDPTNNDDGGSSDPEQDYTRIGNMDRAFIGHSKMNHGGGKCQQLGKYNNIHRVGLGGSRIPTRFVTLTDMEYVHGGDQGWRVNVVPISNNSSSGDYEGHYAWVIDRNWFHSYDYIGTSRVSMFTFLVGNATYSILRNNIVDLSSPHDLMYWGASAFYIGDYVTDYGRVGDIPPAHNFVTNNTVYHYGVQNLDFTLLRNSSGATDTRLMANIFYGDSGTTMNLYSLSAPTVNTDNLTTSTGIFSDIGLGMQPEDFKTSAQQSCTLPTGVRRDFSGAIRTGCTKGAWDFD